MNTSSARSTVMAMGAGLLVAGLVLLGPARTSGPPFTTVHAGRGPLADHLVLNEVQYDPPQTGTIESNYEWFELYNPSSQAISLAGWTIADNNASDPLPDLTIPPDGFAVIAATTSFSQNFPIPALFGTIAGGRIGGGLSNSADRLILRDPDGTTIDALSYGTDVTVFDPAAPDVAAGHSLERIPAGLDTDTAADFIDQPNPSPGQAGSAPTPTLTSTATDTPTPSPTATPTVFVTPTETLTPSITPTVGPPGAVLINEVQYDPPQPGNDAAYEWVELYNNSGTTVDLAGWRLTDNVTDTPLVEAQLEPGEFLVVAATDQFRENFPDFAGRVITSPTGLIGNGLRNSGDQLVLFDLDGAVVDGLSWGDNRAVFDPPAAVVAPGHSLERIPFGSDTGRADDFQDQWQPSPGIGVTEVAPTLTPTPRGSSTPTPTETVTPTSTPELAATPTPSSTPVYDHFAYLPVVIKPESSGP
jgi:hypothetical protein